MNNTTQNTNNTYHSNINQGISYADSIPLEERNKALKNVNNYTPINNNELNNKIYKNKEFLINNFPNPKNKLPDLNLYSENKKSENFIKFSKQDEFSYENPKNIEKNK